MARPKKLAFLCRRAPLDGGNAAEILEAVLIAAAFDQEVHILFVDDGVYQLVDGQRPDPIGARGLEGGFAEFADLDIDHVWVERESLAARGLAGTKFAFDAAPVGRAEIAALLAGMDAVIGA